MSTADRPRGAVPGRAARRGVRGFTFVEITVALGMLSLMALVIERTLSTTNDAEQYLATVRRVTERGQKISYEVFDSVSASRKLFQNDGVGQGYLAALDLSRDPLLAGARLPLFDEMGTLGPDLAGDPHTGNVLLFVREGDPAPCVADATTEKIRYIDTYRFVCVYPHLETRRLVAKDPRKAVDLVVWRSIPYPSYSQIMAIQSTAERKSVVADLYARYGTQVAWDPNGAVDQAFYAVDYLGTVSGTPISSPLVAEDVDVSGRGRLVYANVQLARTDATSYYRRPVFTMDDPASWVPEGFEVKVAGASGSRKVWLHVVVEAQATPGRVAVHANTMIASTRDL